MNLYQTMAIALWTMICEFASSKTDRYFLSGIKKSMANDSAYPEIVGDVVRTFCAVMSKRSKSSMITADGENWPVEDFKFPLAWWSLTRGRIVYATRSADEHAKPYYQFEAVDGKLLTPNQVTRFFDSYNAAQNQGDLMIELGPVPADFNDTADLLQFKALVGENGMTEWNASGTIEDIVAQLLEVECPVDDEFLQLWDEYDERSVAKWLMSVK